MADYIPVRTPGQALTSTTSAAVTGGQLLAVSGSGTVAPTTPATAAAWLGVAAFDAASGALVTIHTGGTQELTASAAITAGATVEAAAAGAVATHTNGTNDANVVGVALTSAASGAKVRVQLAR